jgi:methionine sulfoxide reductase catalytic subunit
MLLLKKRFDVPNASEITPASLVGQRRLILQAMAAGLAFVPPAMLQAQTAGNQTAGNQKLTTKPGSSFGLVTANEPSTPYKDVSTYNNFYEFGVDKDDPARNAGSLKTKPWTVTIEGAVNKPQTIGIEELLKLAPLEERIYRMRCVEGWSMVIPWVGFSLSELIKKVEPTGNAKFLEFVTLSDRKQMPGLRSPVLDWPYIEGLRMDEAMNPMTILGLGLYGEVLPNQNGAPVRLVVPWKYGFKSGKSLVKIRFVEKQPLTSWNKSGPSEYGFFSNVNPDVDHPRWSQSTERRIGQDGFLQRKRKTLMFNGYADQVASLYQGMDLKKFF